MRACVFEMIGLMTFSSRGGFHGLSEPQLAFLQVQSWARNNTPPDTVLSVQLVPASPEATRVKEPPGHGPSER